MTLTLRILIGMAAGFVIGSLLHMFSHGLVLGGTELLPPLISDEGFVRYVVLDGVIYVVGQIFINSLKLLVVPLVLVSLVCGASNISDGAKMGRLGGKAVGLYLVTTALAVSLALGVALVVQPGRGIEAAGAVQEFIPEQAPSLAQVIIDIFPSNPVASMANGEMLQIIVFAILLGIAIAHAGEPGQRIKGVFEDLNAVIMRLILKLIRLAPYGVFCLMTKLFADVGWQEIVKLGVYFLTVMGVLAIHAGLVYPILLRVLGGLDPVRFYSKAREPMLVAFSTASSGATLPVTLRTVEYRLGVRNEIAAFTVPLGATINMDGTAIMQGVATVFIAQYFNIGLDVVDYLMVILTATMASIGTAGVPGVGLIMLTMVLQQVGLPVEGIMLIIGVDRLLDMMRTAVNVAGDAMVASVVAKSEGQLDEGVFEDPEAGREVEGADD
ncbi:MAG: dicarboxylate/amino acid:cation symporter [Gammaproteobacteria bacterium]